MLKLYNYINEKHSGFMLGFIDNFILILVVFVGYFIDISVENVAPIFTLTFSALGNSLSDFIGAMGDKALNKYKWNILWGCLFASLLIPIVHIKDIIEVFN